MKEMDGKEAYEKANAPAESLDDDEANQFDEVLDAVPDWEMPKEEFNPHDLILEPAPDYTTQEEDHVDENKEEVKESPSDPNVQKMSSEKKKELS